MPAFSRAARPRRRMLSHGRGTILFTGATASMRGGKGYAAFASAKFGLRAVAQSMARELGPQNIHVAHLVIDAGVDTAFVRERIKARAGEQALEDLPPDTLMNPDLDRQCLLDAAQPVARRLDLRARSAALSGDMVMTNPEFLFDFGSPNAYLAHRVIPGIEARTGARFAYVPVLLGGVFKLTGNQAPMVAFGGIKNKLEYEQLEMRRFIARHGIAQFQFNPHFPVNTVQIMRGAVAAGEAGMLAPYVEAVFHHMWEAPKKMDDPSVIAAALAASGLDAESLMAAAQSQPVKDRLLANTEAAVARGVFGSPSFFVGEEMYLRQGPAGRGRGAAPGLAARLRFPARNRASHEILMAAHGHGRCAPSMLAPFATTLRPEFAAKSRPSVASNRNFT